jgi:chorismate-pyruvate lyase
MDQCPLGTDAQPLRDFSATRLASGGKPVGSLLKRSRQITLGSKGRLAEMSTQFEQLADEVDRDPELAKSFKEDPQKALKDAARRGPIYQRDKVVYRVVVLALGATVLIAAIGAIVLQLSGEDTPSVLVALGSAAIGAIAGLLAPPPSAT